ncbi:MAG: L-seryl-tRNA(Sec) selenium transferase [Anaerolinea sp.]|nr:L-seryl-tRNA(Sec) selenium transferase [Anaerolinea sp.]
MADNRRQVPSVERVLAGLRANGHAQLPESLATEAARTVLARVRAKAAGGGGVPSLEELVEAARAEARERARPSLRRVINATGVILQTNLGRSPLSERAIGAMVEAAAGYSNLEFDLESGVRGSRHDHVRAMIRRATGAEDGMVVNNNAAALYMALQVFARGREVIISRGQAVEIGGGFRIPDVLRQSGAILTEVGTTNRTYSRDYEAAWTDTTAAILRVHTSNFRVTGFTAEAPLAELAAAAHRLGGLLIDDIGSGCLIDTVRYGMAHEPTVQESLAAGADLVLFSGDKLLGGPQCGIIVGRAELVDRLRSHPLARALRVDKLTIAALNATLRAYCEGTEATEIPVWRMLGSDLAGIKRRARKWAAAAGEFGAAIPSRSMAGGGSLPGEGVATWCAAVRAAHPEDIAAALRRCEPAIAGRVEDGCFLLDPRAVEREDDAYVAARLRQAIHGEI